MLAQLIVGHFVGDYLLQNDKMAKMKKQSNVACAVHCALYTLAVWASSLAALPAWCAAIVFLTHFAIDRGSIVVKYMELARQIDFKNNLGPWSIIVIDNTMHLLTLWAICAVIGF